MTCSDAEITQYLERWLELKGATSENKRVAQSIASSEISLTSLLHSGKDKRKKKKKRSPSSRMSVCFQLTPTGEVHAYEVKW
jgi:hypothetical protein